MLFVCRRTVCSLLVCFYLLDVVRPEDGQKICKLSVLVAHLYFFLLLPSRCWHLDIRPEDAPKICKLSLLVTQFVFLSSVIQYLFWFESPFSTVPWRKDE